MILPPKDYKTWSELAEYARLRAKHSAARNGHQETAYWVRIMRWAQEMAKVDFSVVRALRGALVAVERGYGFSNRAEAYAHAVHCRRMLLNRGEKVERLSLKWLKEAVEKL
jgi:hypothetical protein